jgi:hypothetical protein
MIVQDDDDDDDMMEVAEPPTKATGRGSRATAAARTTKTASKKSTAPAKKPPARTRGRKVVVPSEEEEEEEEDVVMDSGEEEEPAPPPSKTRATRQPARKAAAPAAKKGATSARTKQTTLDFSQSQAQSQRPGTRSGGAGTQKKAVEVVYDEISDDDDAFEPAPVASRTRRRWRSLLEEARPLGNERRQVLYRYGAEWRCHLHECMITRPLFFSHSQEQKTRLPKQSISNWTQGEEREQNNTIGRRQKEKKKNAWSVRRLLSRRELNPGLKRDKLAYWPLYYGRWLSSCFQPS